jgi:hypothetical protein
MAMVEFSKKHPIAAGVAAGFVGLIGEYFNLGRLAKEYASDFPLLGKAIEILPEQLQQVLFYTHPGVALSIATFPIFLAAFASTPGRYLLARVIPDPPSFLSTQLENKKAHELSPFSPAIKFTGRHEDFEALQSFAGGAPGFVFWSIYGPSGVGKTRLAVEWLKHLAARN